MQLEPDKNKELFYNLEKIIEGKISDEALYKMFYNEKLNIESDE